jgi:hypothetical protein
LVWYDWTPGTPEVYYKNSTDGGASWSIATMLTLSLDYARYPDIVVDSSGYLHVVWDYNSPATYEIYYRKSTNGGTTWSTLKRLTWNLGNSYMPEIAVDSSDKLHVVWYDWTPGYPEIYYKNSTDGGSTWSTKRITWNSGNSENPAIAVDSSDNLHVIWKDHTAGNYEIYYKKYIK